MAENLPQRVGKILVRENNFGAPPQGAARAAAESGANASRMTLREVLEQRLRNPTAKVGNQEYIADVAAILRQYMMDESPYKRFQAMSAYRGLPQEDRIRVDALIVAANPNAQSAQGLSPIARELIESLNGAPLSPERERAVAAAAEFEGFSADRRAPDADQEAVEAPADNFPTGTNKTDVRRQREAEIRRQIREEAAAKGQEVKASQMESRVAKEYSRRYRDVESQPEDRPRFSPRGQAEISVPDQGLQAPPLSPEHIEIGRRYLIDERKAAQQALRQELQSRGTLQPEAVEGEVARRLPDLTPEQADEQFRYIHQRAYEQESFRRGRSSDEKSWSIPLDDKAAIAAARKKEQGLRLSDGERRALSPSEPATSKTRRDSNETAPIETYYENLRSTLGYDPWITPDEFNSQPSRGRPSKKPENIVGLGGRQPSKSDDLVVEDDSAAFSERAAEDSLRKELKTESRPLQPKSGKPISPNTARSVGKGSLERLYTEMLRAAGVEKAIKERGGSVRDVSGEFLKPPAYHGFANSEEMADFAIRVIEGRKPLTESIRAQVKADLQSRFEERWGKDLGRSTLPSAEGRPIASPGTSVRDRIEGRVPAATPAPTPAAQAADRPQLDPNWNNPEVQKKKRIEEAQRRAEELAKQVEQWPEDVESMENPARAAEGFGSEDYAGLFRSIIGQGKAPEPPKAATPTPAANPTPQTQVGQPDADVVQAGGNEVDPNDLLGEIEEVPTSEELRTRLNAPPGKPQVQPQAAPKAQPQSAPSARQQRSTSKGRLQKYIKDASRHAESLASAQENSPKFRGAMAFRDEMRRTLQELSQTKGAEPIAQQWAAEVIGPMEAAIQKRFPEGVPGKPTPAPTTAPTQGSKAIWSGPKQDYPVNVVGGVEQGPDGRGYVRVEHNGKQGYVPVDQLRLEPDGTASPAATPTPASQPAPTGDLTPGPSTPIDPLESAAKTPVGEVDGPTLPDPNAGPTPPPVPPAEPASPGPGGRPFNAPPAPGTQPDAQQLSRALWIFRQAQGREPSPQEMRQIMDALRSGGRVDNPPFTDFSTPKAGPAQKDDSLSAWIREAVSLADPRTLPEYQAVKSFIQRSLKESPAPPGAEIMEELRTRRFARPGEDFEELPLPQGSGRSASPEAAAKDAEAAAGNVDAVKATKDAESDKATAVASKAASDADAEAAAKRTEDATNANAAPQPQKAGQSGKPSLPVRGLQAAGSEVGQFLRGGWPYLVKRGAQGVGAATSMAVRHGPLVAGGVLLADYLKDSLPESFRGPVGVAAGAIRSGAGTAADAARRMFEGAAGGSEDMPAGGSGPGGQGPGIIPVSMPGGGPIPGEEGINMMPPPGSGYDTEASLDRIRRIISATKPQSQYQAGTAQRPYGY